MRSSSYLHRATAAALLAFTGACGEPSGAVERDDAEAGTSLTDASDVGPLDGQLADPDADAVDADAVDADAPDGTLADAASSTRHDAELPVDAGTVDGEAAPSCAAEQIDLLFMVDNSGSMSEEQRKLAEVLPTLVTMLTTGYLTPKTAGAPVDFPPVKSLHIGVISSDMGINGIVGQQSCGDVSFDPTAPDPSNPAPAVRMNPPSNAVRYDKPRGDDGVMNTSVAVALAGIWARPAGTTFSVPVSVVVPPDPSCGDVAALPAGQRFIDFNAGSSDPAIVSKQIGCMAKLGKNGCGLEQQLESMLKSVTPSTSSVRFVAGSGGHGDGQNRGFLRPDALLAVVLLSDEEDCSIADTPASRELFNPQSATITEDINIRCALTKYNHLLHPVQRYAVGLKALKAPALVDRILFAGIVGAPQRVATEKVYAGSAQLDALLMRSEMTFVPRPIPNTQLMEPTPACVSSGGHGSAAPGRRFVELAREFGERGMISSICEDEYASTLQFIARKIAGQLNGPRCAP